MADRKRCCCNCRRNIRTGNPGEVTCHCEIDGHYISYVMAFDGWCRRWARETKWDQEKSERVLELYGKLKPYADAEEQGRLVILPCKVGDALFVTDEGTPPPAVRMVELVTWRNGKVFIRAVNSRTGIDYYCFAEDFGKTVFLTREEAEAAMKGLKGEAKDV